MAVLTLLAKIWFSTAAPDVVSREFKTDHCKMLKKCWHASSTHSTTSIVHMDDHERNMNKEQPFHPSNNTNYKNTVAHVCSHMLRSVLQRLHVVRLMVSAAVASLHRIAIPPKSSEMPIRMMQTLSAQFVYVTLRNFKTTSVGAKQMQNSSTSYCLKETSHKWRKHCSLWTSR